MGCSRTVKTDFLDTGNQWILYVAITKEQKCNKTWHKGAGGAVEREARWLAMVVGIFSQEDSR